MLISYRNRSKICFKINFNWSISSEPSTITKFTITRTTPTIYRTAIISGTSKFDSVTNLSKIYSKSKSNLNWTIMLSSITMTKLTNYHDGKLGVIEQGAYADILLVDGNPLEDITVIGGNELWLKAPKPTPIETIRLIMKDGVIYKNTLGE